MGPSPKRLKRPADVVGNAIRVAQIATAEAGARSQIQTETLPQDDLTEIAIQKGFASLEATLGRVPDNFKLLAEHSPGGFAGYGLMRDAIMRDRDNGGALDLKRPRPSSSTSRFR